MSLHKNKFITNPDVTYRSVVFASSVDKADFGENSNLSAVLSRYLQQENGVLDSSSLTVRMFTTNSHMKQSDAHQTGSMVHLPFIQPNRYVICRSWLINLHIRAAHNLAMLFLGRVRQMRNAQASNRI